MGQSREGVPGRPRGVERLGEVAVHQRFGSHDGLAPAAVPPDTHGKDLVAFRIGCCQYVASRDTGHIMLGAPASEDNHQSAPLSHTEMVGVIRQSRKAPPVTRS